MPLAEDLRRCTAALAGLAARRQRAHAACATLHALGLDQACSALLLAHHTYRAGIHGEGLDGLLLHALLSASELLPAWEAPAQVLVLLRDSLAALCGEPLLDALAASVQLGHPLLHLVAWLAASALLRQLSGAMPAEPCRRASLRFGVQCAEALQRLGAYWSTLRAYPAPPRRARLAAAHVTFPTQNCRAHQANRCRTSASSASSARAGSAGALQPHADTLTETRWHEMVQTVSGIMQRGASSLLMLALVKAQRLCLFMPSILGLEALSTLFTAVGAAPPPAPGGRPSDGVIAAAAQSGHWEAPNTVAASGVRRQAAAPAERAREPRGAQTDQDAMPDSRPSTPMPAAACRPLRPASGPPASNCSAPRASLAACSPGAADTAALQAPAALIGIAENGQPALHLEALDYASLAGAAPRLGALRAFGRAVGTAMSQAFYDAYLYCVLHDLLTHPGRHARRGMRSETLLARLHAALKRELRWHDTLVAQFALPTDDTYTRSMRALLAGIEAAYAPEVLLAPLHAAGPDAAAGVQARQATLQFAQPESAHAPLPYRPAASACRCGSHALGSSEACRIELLRAVRETRPDAYWRGTGWIDWLARHLSLEAALTPVPTCQGDFATGLAHCLRGDCDPCWENVTRMALDAMHCRAAGAALTDGFADREALRAAPQKRGGPAAQALMKVSRTAAPRIAGAADRRGAQHARTFTAEPAPDTGGLDGKSASAKAFATDASQNARLASDDRTLTADESMAFAVFGNVLWGAGAAISGAGLGLVLHAVIRDLAGALARCAPACPVRRTPARGMPPTGSTPDVSAADMAHGTALEALVSVDDAYFARLAALFSASGAGASLLALLHASTHTTASEIAIEACLAHNMNGERYQMASHALRLAPDYETRVPFYMRDTLLFLHNHLAFVQDTLHDALNRLHTQPGYVTDYLARLLGTRDHTVLAAAQAHVQQYLSAAQQYMRASLRHDYANFVVVSTEQRARNPGNPFHFFSALPEEQVLNGALAFSVRGDPHQRIFVVADRVFFADPTHPLAYRRRVSVHLGELLLHEISHVVHNAEDVFYVSRDYWGRYRSAAQALGEFEASIRKLLPQMRSFYGELLKYLSRSPFYARLGLPAGLDSPTRLRLFCHRLYLSDAGLRADLILNNADFLALIARDFGAPREPLPFAPPMR